MIKPSKITGNISSNSTSAAMNGIVAFSPMQTTAVKAWSAMGREALQFAACSLQKSFATQQAILGCKTLEDFHKVQADFYSSALQDYRARVARMMGPFSATDVAGLSDAVPTLKRGYDDVPL